MIWTVRRIDNSSIFDRYMSTGKSDHSLYSNDVIVADYNVFELYNSQSCKPKFYQGHFDSDFDYIKSEAPKESVDGYIEWLEKYDDELPQGYFQKRTVK